MTDQKAAPARHKRSRKKRRQGELKPALPEPRAGAVAQPSTRLIAALCLALYLATAAVYWQTAHYAFIAYDDDQYVYENPHVQAGLTLPGVAWAWTTFFYSYWHPLTWMSLMLDRQLFGSYAGGFHLMNVALHMAAAVLLFLALARMTRCPWRSVVVAGIFALHPLHVESVVWVTERKDVLSTALAMLALLLYIRYTERLSVRRYLWAALAYALSLAAKPMLVTFPFVLLLVDFWPLQRIKLPLSMPALKPLLLEKIPLLAMAAVSSVLTVIASRSNGAVATLTSFSLPARIANACIAYMTYLWKAFWPFGLGVLYPAVPPDADTALVTAVVLAAITTAALLAVGRRPYLAIGWLWYLGTLVPVSGLVQAGLQTNADRFTYLPLVGFSMAVVWGVADAVAKRPVFRRAAAVLAGAALLLLAIGAHAQAAYWRDSRTLFEHTLEVTNRNYIILNNLGVTLAADGRHEDAIADYRQAIAINPDYAEARANLGHELLGMGKMDEAYPALVEALRLKPDAAVAQGDLGTLLAARGEYPEARQHMQESLRLAPANAEMQSNLCYILQRLGRLDDAISRCDEAIRLKPDSVVGHCNRGTALAAQGKNAEAETEFSRVLTLDPNNVEARAGLVRLRAHR
jgi:protein O-mannosyl-transferase